MSMILLSGGSGGGAGTPGADGVFSSRSQAANSGTAYGIVGLTGGGATKLDGLTTVGATLGWMVWYDNGTTLELWELIAGTNAEDGLSYVRPDDYNGATNAVVWVLRG